MSKNVDLTSKEWCDLVFEGKNKAFGGYLLQVFPEVGALTKASKP